LGVVGWEMSPRVRTIAGIATQLLYAALLGAAYGAATSRRSSHATRQLVDAGLVFAAALLSPELPREPRQRRSRRSRAAKLRLLALAPITPSRVFGQTTTLALKALTR
jgi:hypothetical protein